MTGARGQAAVEFVFGAGLAAVLAVSVVPLFQVWQARARAERIADQAAVLVAEGRPVPAALRRSADVQVGRGSVRAVVEVGILGRSADIAATARVP
ncbi:MAG TPA: hypothetical protein VE777_17935 [Gaiellales bacterium]|nr:hypothetical protein [Gaiellales bacterium]